MARVVVIGAGPAGLTAGYLLQRRYGIQPVILEADDHSVGGLSRTVVRDGWRFDIGGHRFYTKVAAVQVLWEELLAPEDFLVRPRLSRILYRGRFYDYPLRVWGALRTLGPLEATRCALSYLWARLFPPRDRTTLEGWVVARFGRRMYRHFFKGYNEKIWGVPVDRLPADFAAQRIRELSLGKAVANALLPRSRRAPVTSLVERFHYPRLGPGMMWERCRDEIVGAGGTLHLDARVVSVHHEGGRAHAVETVDRAGRRTTYPADHVVSSMPIGELVLALDPPAPEAVQDAARALRHRDFLTVALVVPSAVAFPDNWIYVHGDEVRVARIQNYGRWSPDLVRGSLTCLGLEYFVHEGDDLWSSSDDDLVALATAELGRLGLVAPGLVQEGFVVRVPKAYPFYHPGYQTCVARIRDHLAACAANVAPVGRNGMHRYNNQDHSMLTAMLAVENLVSDAGHDLWSANVDDTYLEEVRSGS